MSNLNYYVALIQNLNSIKLEKYKLNLEYEIKEHYRRTLMRELDNNLFDCYNAICELYFSSIDPIIEERIINLHTKELFKLSEQYNSDQEFSNKYPFISKVFTEMGKEIEKENAIKRLENFRKQSPGVQSGFLSYAEVAGRENDTETLNILKLSLDKLE